MHRPPREEGTVTKTHRINGFAIITVLSLTFHHSHQLLVYNDPLTDSHSNVSRLTLNESV